MIYVESFRHFCQEWIEIQHPKDGREWPWRPNRKLYLVNLYAVASEDIFTWDTMPLPLISLLIDNFDVQHPFIEKSQSLYRDYFLQEQFQLPRKYLYDPLGQGKVSTQKNRYDYGSNGYPFTDSYEPNARVIHTLSQRKHVRHSIYDSHRFELIRERLHELSEATDRPIRYAENLLDATPDAVGEDCRPSPDTMIIQAPIMGIVPPIKKSHNHRIINGTLVLCKEPVYVTIDGEPSKQEYEKITHKPFAARPNLSVAAHGVYAKAIFYAILECPSCSFSFQEYFPKDRVQGSNNLEYVYMVNHSFNVDPVVYTNMKNQKTRMSVRLGHSIQEGLIQDTPAHSKYFRAQDEKLFKRSDMPPGFTKSPGGQTVSVKISM